MKQVSSYIQTVFATSIKQALDAAPSAGKIQIYTGARPVNCGSTTAGNTLLCEFTLGKPCGTIVDSSLFMVMPDAVQSSSAGTPSFMRFVDGYGAVVMDIDASDLGLTSHVNAGTWIALDFIRISIDGTV